MRLDTSQQFRLEQQMRLAPRIIQAMEILQLPLLALEERIEAEMMTNPVLELREPGVDLQAPPAPEDEQEPRGEQPLVVEESSDRSKDFQRLTEFEEEYGGWMARSDTARHRDVGERDRKLDAMANTPAPQQTLSDYLHEQWMFVEAPEPVKEAGRLIIDNINDDGYLRIALEELVQQTAPPGSVATLQEALKLVQALEPRGVGARDLKECLLLQLDTEAALAADVSLEKELVLHYLGDIEKNRLPMIARRTGKTVERIKKAIENLSHLNPRPGSLVGRSSAPVIMPDAIVDIDDKGQIAVIMPESNTPLLYISRTYRRLARDRQTDKQTRQFIRNNIRSAQWLIGAIEQRRQTVRRVVEEVFKVQRQFLDSGPESLRPLPMMDVANKVGVHVATVSRAVAGKYVQTPRGIFPLRMFFSGGMTTTGGQDVSWDAIRVKLKELIDAEDKAKPLNDEELVSELQKHGIKIARRTIAKYRDLMAVPPARQRRQY